MTYVIAEPCIDEKDKSSIDALPEKWTPFVRVNAIFVESGAPAVAAALAEHGG
jgi:ubiquitin-protein ligase